MSTSHAKQPIRTLVTGASGFTGRYLVERLLGRGHTVIETVAGRDEVETPTRVRLDITSPDACRRVIAAVRPDYIVHLAAISFVGHNDPLDFYRVNVLGTLNLLEACEAVGHTPRKLLIASSANVYGNVTSSAIDETFPVTPVNHYAASKAAMETMVRTWFDRLPILIVRPFNYTGRGQTSNFLVPKIVEHFARRDAAIELGNIDVARDFSDVRYVASAYEALLDSDAAAETVNVCTGTPYTLALNRITAVPADVLKLAAAGRVGVGSVADLCVFDRHAHWRVEPRALKSQGHNTPFLGYELPARVRATIVSGHVAFEQR